MHDLAKLIRLDATHRADLLRAAVLLPAIALALRCKGLRAVRGAIARLESIELHSDPAGRARQIARFVSVAARRGPVRANCLVRSLTLEWLLKREGIHAELRLGVRKAGNQLEAHAWVEHEGRPLMDCADAEQFRPFESPLPEPPQ